MSEPQTPAQRAYEAWVRSKEAPPMPPTPGQIAYEAFDTAFPADRFVRLAWDEQARAVQAAWEAAAQAVQRDAVRYVQAVIRHWNEFGPGYGFVVHMNALETWLEAHRQEDRP